MQNTPCLPHHRLIVFGVACELVVAIKDAHVSDAKLRDEALRAIKGVTCNIAEGAGRVTRADKAPARSPLLAASAARPRPRSRSLRSSGQCQRTTPGVSCFWPIA